ncbi:MAG: chorismate synthase [Candidatus Omnitrophota bacterium]|nr:chorismate synthase [Candidatus Omnitrophota bacterium]MDZ4242704.1 chorismate synthase [Candidatus Omnitrophota bacterium]
MAGNSFGQLFRITTFGESHGPAIGVVIDGVPPGIDLTPEDIQKELDRRRPGQSKITTQRKESDRAEILSGIFEGKSTGTPLAILIRNEDQRSQDYANIKDVFRPGHADYTYQIKYGIRDYRGGGRSSGRETACRVAAGAVAKKILHYHHIQVLAYTLAVADVYAQKIDYSVIEKNLVRAPDMDAAERMIQKIEEARKDCDSLGGVIETVVKGCPAGLGDPVFDKLNARLAHAMLSIGTIRGIEFGTGFAATKMRGSAHNDAFCKTDRQIHTKTNHAGGILGGISNGEDILFRVAVKPPSSIAKNQDTVDISGEDVSVQVKGRHDPCICPRVVPVVEAMTAVTLADALLIQKSIRS